MPPYATESVDEADTAPEIAWSGPESDPSVRPLAPLTVSAVVLAYGNVEARVVDVA